MDFGIKDKKAIVTGGGRGLGRGIALNLAKEGVKVAVVSRTPADVESIIKEMGGRKAGHYGVALDLTKEGGPAELVKLLKKEFGDPDIVVHNLGGTLEITDPFCSIEDWRKVWRFNLEVAIKLNLLLLPKMKAKKWGRIVHISSISSMENHGPVSYCSIKAALTAYSRSIGRVVAPDGIIVTAVLPGAVFTEKGYWDIASKEKPEHVRKYLDERMAIKRFGTLDEIGTVVTFLCSEQASFCVGSIVPVDGGQGRSYFGQ
jgi:3-oxoacyl-[acyl-carrier protein] reductase